MYITIKITPERSIRNYVNLQIVKEICDLYLSPIRRISNLRLLPEKFLMFDTIYSEDVTYFLTFPSEIYDIIRQKIRMSWEGSVLEKVVYPEIGNLDYKSVEMVYIRHNFFSLKTDTRDNDPLTSQLTVLGGMSNEDIVRVNIQILPYSRRDWQDITRSTRDVIKGDKMPRRRTLRDINPLRAFGELVELSFREAGTTIFEVMESRSEDVPPSQDSELLSILYNGHLSQDTNYKVNSNVCKTFITIFSYSENKERAESNLKCVADSFKDLTLDNELISRPVIRRKEKINSFKPIFSLDPNIMSDREVAKLIQLPSAGLQDEWKQIVAIRIREPKISSVLLDASKGVPLCSYRFRGNEYTAHIPTYNPDETCLPRVVVAGVGQGKTQGFASNLAVELFLNGNSVITIDCAKKEIRNQIAHCIPKDKWDKVIFLDLSDIDFIPHLDWHEALRYSNRMAGSRLGTELSYFFKKNADPAGDRTRKYLELAAKTISINSSTNPLDILMCLTTPLFRKRFYKNIKDPLILRDWEDFDSMSEAKRREIYDPVLYRLNMIMGNDALKSILCQDPILINDQPAIDIRKIMDEGYLLVIDAKKSLFGKQGLIDLMSYLMAKIWLATLTRPEEGETKMCHLILDEPQQWLTGSAYHFEEMVTESRKWRLGLTFLFHSWAQLKKESKELVDILKSAICHYHIYSTSMDEIKKMTEIIDPYTPEEAFKEVKRFMAINKIRVDGEYHTFIGNMLPPPRLRYPKTDMTSRITECREKYGRGYEEVQNILEEKTRNIK